MEVLDVWVDLGRWPFLEWENAGEELWRLVPKAVSLEMSVLLLML